MLYRFVA